ncbi:MAG: DNA-binding protein [Pedobacter sp.]|nr:MAG: DNA-binding protein [Pedobacter sp.]
MKLLTNIQTAELLGLKPNTLEIWRVYGKGPTLRKLGRSIRYAEADILDWLDTHTCTSTSQYPIGANIQVQTTTVV